jgi:hypothetical protein
MEHGMRKYFIVAGAIAALAAPSAALADAPTGDPILNPSTDLTWDTAGAAKTAAEADGENLIAWGSSALIQNGQFISGKSTGTPDWQHQKGNRSAEVQAELAKTGLGSLAVK